MEELDLHFNFVIVGSVGYYLVGYHDIINMSCVSYHSNYSDGFEGLIPRLLLRCNFSRLLNHCIKTPFASYVYPRLYPHYFQNDRPLCYLFFGNTQYVYQTTYLDYLRQHNPGIKLVLFMQDLVSRTKGLCIEKVSSKFDLLISYDRGDAKRYNMVFHPTPMSRIDIRDDSNINECDIYFCGFAKNRWRKVHEIYNKCQSLGLRCDFYLIDIPHDAERISGIHYLNHPFSYLENLKHVIKCRCILEIMQDNADGFTPRLWESIMYDRHLLTNNRQVFLSDYYYSLGHHSIDKLIDGTIVKDIAYDVVYPETIKNSLSPIHLLTFIDYKLSKK